MWWLVAILIILIPVAYLLFAPFFVEIDSNIDLYRVRFHRVAVASLRFGETSIFINLRIAWWKKDFDLLKHREKKEKPAKKQVEKTKRKFSSRNILKKIKRVMKSFKIKRCRILVDTGDMPLNGILYPWLYLFSRSVGQTVIINFHGENEIILQIENNAARMLRAYFRSV